MNPLKRKDARQMKYLALAVLLVMGGLPDVSVAQEATLGSRAVIGGGEYSSGGGMTVAVERKVIQGAPHLCGIWAESNWISAYARGKSRDVLAKGAIYAGNVRLVDDLRFLRKEYARPTYAGLKGNCVPVGAASGNAALVIRLPKKLVHVERGRAGGLEIWFKPSKRANPAYSHGESE